MNEPMAGLRDYVQILSTRAWNGLRSSEYLEPAMIDSGGLRFGRKQLMLWRNAQGFHDYEPQTYTVFQPFETQPPRLRLAIWQRSVDMERFREFSDDLRQGNWPQLRPTFAVQDCDLDAAELQMRLEEAYSLTIPVCWPWNPERDSLTEDVGMVGFEFFDQAEPQASVRCAWSVDLPEQWEPVSNWFGRMFQWLDSHFQPKR